MKQLTCIAIDDEPIALEIMEAYISDTESLELKGLFQNPIEALQFIQKEKVDVVFIDIQMPQINGLNFAQSLIDPPQFIFATAYPQHAAQSYELNAVDYLVKPFGYERFLQACNKLNKPTEENIENGPNEIFIKSEYKLIKVNLDEVLFIESVKDYVVFQIRECQLKSLMSIKKLEEQLPKNNFQQVHRSFIVNKSAIDELDKNHLIVDGYRIPIGESFRKDTKSFIENKLLK